MVRKLGVQEFRDSGVQEFRGSGVQGFRGLGVSKVAYLVYRNKWPFIRLFRSEISY